MFRAWSIIDKFLEQEQVRMDWFVVGRTEPPAPWDVIIEDYDENDDNAVYDQIMANELLNQEEVEKLTIYLENKHQLHIKIEEVNLPIKSGGLSHGLLLISGAKGFYPLAEEEDYPLEVSILGHYDCAIPDSPPCLSTKDLDAGMEWLDYLAVNWLEGGRDRSKDRELLQKLYTETGLRVVRD